jgi:hypothetical protein
MTPHQYHCLAAKKQACLHHHISRCCRYIGYCVVIVEQQAFAVVLAFLHFQFTNGKTSLAATMVRWLV